MPLGQSRNRGHQLRQACAQGHKGQRDHGFRNTHAFGNLGAVIHQQPCADSNTDSTACQFQDRLPQRHFLFVFRGLAGFSADKAVFLSVPDRIENVDGKYDQQDHSDPPGKDAGGIGRSRVQGRRGKEENDRHLVGNGVHLARTDCEGQRGDQRRVADHAADRVAVGDSAVASERACG